MSILIKDIKLPKGDEEIRLRINAKGEVYKFCGAYPAELYEAIELPPHGRLIDESAVIDAIKEAINWVGANMSNAERPLKIGYLAAYYQSLAHVRKAPTIIEREE